MWYVYTTFSVSNHEGIPLNSEALNYLYDSFVTMGMYRKLRCLEHCVHQKCPILISLVNKLAYLCGQQVKISTYSEMDFL